MHVFVDEDDSSADHIWSLSYQERETSANKQIPEFQAGLVHIMVPVETRLDPNKLDLCNACSAGSEARG